MLCVGLATQLQLEFKSQRFQLLRLLADKILLVSHFDLILLVQWCDGSFMW